MTESENKIELNVNGNKREYMRNVETLHKNGSKVDISYELEKILMGSGLQEGDSVTLKVEINKNGKESCK